MSTAWLLCLPGANGLSSAQFSEAMSSLLCSPSPASLPRLGERIGKSRVDLFGDRLCTESGLTGDLQRKRHDEIKRELNSTCIWAGLDAECEPYGLFGHLIPQQPLNRIDRSRARQVLRPDFKLKLLSTDGTYESRVADVKTVSCGAPSWYKVGERAVQRRAAVVPGEYAAKARAMDLELGVDGQGPASRRLQELGEVIPLVFGGFAEVSEGVHEFVDILARQRLKKEGLSSGVRSSDNRLGVVVGQIRRRLSLATWKANTNCLLSRTTLCGDGATEAGKRRQWQRVEEEKMRREKEAVWRARVSGHHIVRRGRFFLD